MVALFARIRALFGKRGMDRELDEELRFHIQMETEKNLRAGLTPDDARRRALLAFGGVERFKEQSREERGVRPIEDLLADVRFSFRALRKNPGFTAVAVFSLAVGIGANTAIFSLVNAILIRDLPYQAPEELVNLYRDRARSSFDALNYPDYLEVQEATAGLLSELGGYQYALSQRETRAGVEPVVTELVTGNYMSLLGLSPALGRIILPEDHVAEGAHPVVMLGNRYWKTAFGGDTGVVGQEVRLGGRAFTIVGVAPPEFLGSIRGMAPAFFAPIMMINEVMPGGGDPLESRGTNAFNPVGRLREGVALPRLRVALNTVAGELKAAYPGVWDPGDDLHVLPTEDVIFSPESDGAAALVNFIAMGVVGLVLLIACANLAGFLLARAVDRRKEVALRLALGATRGRLIRQLMTETVVLAFLGGAVGIPLALWILELALRTTLPFPVPMGFDLTLDWTVLGFTLGVSMLTGLGVGLVPALQATRPALAPSLKDEGGALQGNRTLALGRLLVMGQMATAVVLLVVAGLFIRSFGASRLLNPGFGREPTALLTFMIPAQDLPDQEGLVRLSSFLDEARSIPGVTEVAAVSNIHLNPLNSMFLDVNVAGVPAPEGRSAHMVDFTSVSPGFFSAAGIPLLEGRDFGSEDREEGLRVAIVNQAMARQFWPQGGALGQTIEVEVPGWESVTVVGVVGTAKIHSLGEPPTPFLYLPYSQAFNATATVMAVGPDPQGKADALYRMARERHPDLIVYQATTMAEHVGVMLIFSRLTAILSSVFAGMALGLSVIGLYGMVNYAVARRTKEMGIRLSLGATEAQVVGLQIRDGMRLVLTGGVVGLAGAALAGQGLGSFLVGVSPLDLPTFGGALGLLTLVAFLAAYLPARRASRVNPVMALKSE